MLRSALRATPGTAPASRRRRLWAGALCAGLAGAALVGVGPSDAQDDYYPTDPPTTDPGSTPTTTSPPPAASPGSSPTTTSPTPAPSPTVTPPTAGKNTIVIKGTSSANYRFSPRRLTVRRGKRVTWRWNSNAPHNVVFRRLRKRSRTASEGRFKLPFRRRGTYRYLCTVHEFGGKVVVR